MQIEFIKYIIAFIIFSIVISLVLLRTQEEERSNTVAMYILAWVGIPTFFLAFSVFLSFKNEKFTEIIGISIMIPTMIILFISYTTDEFFVMDNRARNVQII